MNCRCRRAEVQDDVRQNTIDRTCSAPIVAVMDHAPGFLKIVNELRPKVKEITVQQARMRLRENPKAVLVDVREDSEWDNGHAAEAVHFGKGGLERDVGEMVS